ncbi:hypothetical protein MFUM_710029 [Methylacidiphilum fumariolicum SolV]|uniref:Uncharacterized protein n=2 Tax=Candidatus Methylacidiphilum fumarolicum TaxID=591154 RepID=I0JZG3_METFB|nr:conserved protein of unknown function [Candidatus Methylacidiphilum fumarolicum]CCG92632.1 hypothetical protein MFUM_710029 [Methylacidiphilum fumariolicum SolV]
MNRKEELNKKMIKNIIITILKTGDIIHGIQMVGKYVINIRCSFVLAYW